MRVCLGKKHVFDLIGIFTGGGEVDVGVYVVLLPNLRGRSWFADFTLTHSSHRLFVPMTLCLMLFSTVKVISLVSVSGFRGLCRTLPLRALQI